jgi:hypothetical protein
LPNALEESRGDERRGEKGWRDNKDDEEIKRKKRKEQS